MSTITKEFTKEQLQQIEAAAKEVMWPVVWSEKKAREHFSEKITPKVVLELARIALASLEAEAVITVGDDAGDALAYRRLIQTFAPGTKLYTAPPAPVSVPECFKRLLHHAYGMTMGHDWNKGTMAGHHRTKLCQAVEECRAAMLQSFGNSEQLEHVTTTYKLSDAVEALRNSGIAIDAEKIQEELDALNSPVIPDCSCLTCRPVTFTDSRFVVCPECGNKRCPHANDHRHACTGSNEPGQNGSAYPAAPQQEAKP